MNAAPLGRILIVDDEAAPMRALRDILRDQGYETEGFTAGEDALGVLRERQFDLLLTDLVMPGMDGVALLTAALKIDSQLVGILMTGKGAIETLPVDTLKIDRSFVADMTVGPQGLALVSTIINLAHSLKLNVVAEGVETDEQSRLLRLLDCDEMQGFLFSKPVSGDAFEAAFLSPTSEAAGA